MTAPPPEVLAEIGKAVQGQDFVRANDLALRAAGDGFEHPALFSVQAMWHERNGRDADAAKLFQRAEALAPADPAILNALGLCLSRLKRFDEAVTVLSKATAIRPTQALGHFRLGHTLWQAGKFPEAEAPLKQALVLDPQLGAALSCFAAVRAAQGDMKSAASYARRALQSTADDPLAVSVAAAAELAEGRTEEAEERIRSLLTAANLPLEARVMALGLRGQALRAQGRTADSFESYATRNDLLKSQQGTGREVLSLQLRELNEFLRRAAPSFWRPRVPTTAASAARVHVFFASFPRSGIEVLAQLLERHPEVAMLRGTDALAAAAGTYLSSQSALQNLAALDAQQLAAERDTYQSALRACGLRVDGKVLIDTSPANALRLPLIAKLFPDARVVAMQRDPRDVIASCFMELPRVLQVLGSTFDLEGIAHVYDEAANNVRASRDRMTLPIAAVRYENLIADREGSLSATCEFIGVDWDQDQFSRRSARENDFGYASEQPGMWREWADVFQPILPILRPWVQEGGYA